MAGVWKRNSSKNYAAVFRDKNGIRRCISTGTSNRKQARKIADTYETAARTKRPLLQTQKVIECLHEEMTGEMIARVTTRSRIVDWVATKKPEIASTSLSFYQNSLGKFLEFLGPKADAPMRDVTKADIIAFRNRLLTQVSAKTANHDLRAVKTLFKSAREDEVIAEDPAVSVKSAHNKATSANKRSFTLDELRVVLDVADPEWKSMVLFGLYIGQRLADVATLRWSNVDLVKGEIRLTTRRTATTLLHEAGVPAAVVQSLIGHDSEEVHQLKDALASAAAKLPDLR
jgi:integrase